MRRFVALLALVMCNAAAQKARPPVLEPIPGPPPPPEPGVEQPEVRIPSDLPKDAKVEPIRQAGRIVMLKVTPLRGKPYYLVDTTGAGNWMRRDSLDDGNRGPMWPLYIFD
jgi:hypothetical protein